MKYIKLFEGFFDFFDFSNPTINHRLWIETDDWWKWDETVRNEKPEELTSEEISIILKTFKGDGRANRTDSRLPWFIDSYVVVPRLESKDKENSCINITLISGGSVIIYKFHDDRWMAELFDEDDNVRDAKFLCETYKGLINWIEDWREKIKNFI